jgi:CRP-like cAMP-binding protein
MQPTLKTLILSTEQRADLLDKSAWSLGFTRSDLLVLAEFMKACAGEPGALLTLEGETESSMGILLEGSAAVVKAAAGGSQKTVGRLGKDKSFGEMSVLNREPRSATVVAETDVRLLILPRTEFDRLMDTQPKIAAKFLLRIARLLSNRLRETTGLLAEQMC